MYKVELLTGERNRPNDQTMAESRRSPTFGLHERGLATSGSAVNDNEVLFG